MTKQKVTIVVMDGVVAEVYAPDSISVELIDYDIPAKRILTAIGEACPSDRYELLQRSIDRWGNAEDGE